MGVTAPQTADGITLTEILPIAIDTVPLHLHNGAGKTLWQTPNPLIVHRLHLTGGENPHQI